MIKGARPGVILIVGAIVTGVVTWATLIAAGRAFGAQEYAEFASWWSLYFALTSVLAGLQQEVTRTQASPRREQTTPRSLDLLVLSVGLGLPSCVVFLRLVPSLDVKDAVVLGAVSLLLSVVLVLATESLGMMAAEGRWAPYAFIGVADAVVRLPILLVIGAAAPPFSYLVGLAGGLLVFLVPWALGWWRFGASAHFGGPGYVRGALPNMLSAGCLGLLSVGIPVLAAATGSLPSSTAGLLGALVVVRSPAILLAIACRPVLLREMVRRPRAVGSASRLLLVVASAALVTSVVSTAVTPWLIRMTFGDDFKLSSAEAGLVGMSAVLLAAMVLVGTLLVAVRDDAPVLVGWIAAVVTTIAVLSLPLAADARITAALVAGPIVGVAMFISRAKVALGARLPV